MTTVMFVLIAFLLSQTGGAPAVTQQAANARVDGTVVRTETNQPIADARILFARTDAHLSQSIVVRTDTSGRFSAVNLPAGQYRLFAEHEDYVRAEYRQLISVSAGQRLDNVSFALARLGSISGRIVNEFGEPAPSIFVRALTSRMVAETKTNDLGEYRLFGLPAGAYVVSAERCPGPRIEQPPARGGAAVPGLSYIVPGPPSPDSPGEGQSQQVLTGILRGGAFIDPRALTRRTYPVIFFPGTTDRSGANPVELRAGAAVNGIDIQLVVR